MKYKRFLGKKVISYEICEIFWKIWTDNTWNMKIPWKIKHFCSLGRSERLYSILLRSDHFCWRDESLEQLFWARGLAEQLPLISTESARPVTDTCEQIFAESFSVTFYYAYQIVRVMKTKNTKFNNFFSDFEVFIENKTKTTIFIKLIKLVFLQWEGVLVFSFCVMEGGGDDILWVEFSASALKSSKVRSRGPAALQILRKYRPKKDAVTIFANYSARFGINFISPPFRKSLNYEALRFDYTLHLVLPVFGPRGPGPRRYLQCASMYRSDRHISNLINTISTAGRLF